MKKCYISQVRVCVDGADHYIETISGQGYTPDFVKRSAEDRVRALNPGKTIASVILETKYFDNDEFKKVMGGTPNWLGGPAADQ